MSPRAAWASCLAAGIAVQAASMAFGWIPDLAPCGPSDGLGAVLAFELARSPAEVAALFGSEPCRTALATAQARAAWLDALAFIPAYAAFLSLAGWALRDDRRRALVVTTIVVTAALLDEIEGALLLAILDDLPGDPMWFGPLYWIVRAKFALLSLAAFAIAALLVRRGWIAMIAAVAIAGGALLSAAVLLTNPHHPLMMEGHRISWTALLVAAAIFTLRPPVPSAAAPRWRSR